MNSVSVEAIDPLGNFLGWQTVSASHSKSAVVGPPGRRLVALLSGGAGPLSCQRQGAHRGWAAERIGAADDEKSVVEWAPVSAARSVGDGEGFEGAGERSSQCRHLALVHERDGRRRGRLGSEAAVSVLQEVSVRSGWVRVVSSSLLMNGSRAGSRLAQGSLSNYRLKLTARGRVGAGSCARSRAAA